SEVAVRKYVRKTIAIAPRTKRVAYHIPNRSPNAGPDALRPGAGSTDDIADASNRLQALGLKGTIDLLAEPAHQDIDNVGLRIEAVVPHVRQDHRLRDDLAGVAHQIFEQRELARAELDRSSGAGDLSRQQIEAQITDDERGCFWRARCTTHQRLDT